MTMFPVASLWRHPAHASALSGMKQLGTTLLLLHMACVSRPARHPRELGKRTSLVRTSLFPPKWLIRLPWQLTLLLQGPRT